MRALTWHGKHDVRVETVPDPEIVNPRDAIIKITSTAICGSDLHLYDGYIPTHEGGRHPRPRIHGRGRRGRRRRARSRRASASSCRSPIAAATASSARSSSISACDNSNPGRDDRTPRELLYGHPMGGGVRLFAPHRRLCRRAGRICPRALFRCRADRRSRPSRGRPGAVPVRHPADRLDGGGELPTSSPATRSRCGAAARSGCSRSSRRFLHGRAPRDRHRPLSAPARAGEAARRRDHRLREVDVREALTR